MGQVWSVREDVLKGAKPRWGTAAPHLPSVTTSLEAIHTPLHTPHGAMTGWQRSHDIKYTVPEAEFVSRALL